MKPEKINFYVYAQTEEEVKQLQECLNDFVRQQYNKGVLVTAKKLIDVIKMFGSNVIVSNYLSKS